VKITCAKQTRALGIWGAFALACGCASDVRAQAATPDENLIDRGQLESVLDFEANPRGNQPGGWGGGPAGTIFVDEAVVHGGKRSARLERTADSSGALTSLTKALPMSFTGTTIELRGFLRTQDVSRFAGLWMSEDGDSGVLALDNMQGRRLSGTTDWTEYSIALPLIPEAKRLLFGALLSGTGTAWVDDLQLLVDGEPIWEAPRRAILRTALDQDHEFDGGSGLHVTLLSRSQVENLTTLGRVWGFLKYHHPTIRSGKRHWDYELLRVLPAILAAPNRAAANGAILAWIDRLGAVEPCNPCTRLEPTDLYMGPELGWLSDERVLGRPLSERLRWVARNRIADEQFYVSLVPDIEKPRFEHEPPYAAVKLPDSGFQLLGLYRFWNIIEYWYPYRDVIGEDWTRVLREFTPRIMIAQDGDGYRREFLALLARVHDGHIQLAQTPGVQPPVGPCQAPVTIRYIEGHAVVTGHSNSEAERKGLQVGDVVLAVDGVPTPKLFRSWAPYYSASNESTKMAYIARALMRGACGAFEVRVRRARAAVELSVERSPMDKLDVSAATHDDLPGETFRLLTPEVAYLRLSSVSAVKAGDYIKAALGTKGLIIDIRGYPAEFMVWTLGPLLIDKDTAFSRNTKASLSNPGAFYWNQPHVMQPLEPHYPGRVAILVDENSISQSEFTTMAFRASPRAIVVGSTTAGADGNISPFSLPGGLHTQISGNGTFHPDKTPTQRVGIIPDLVVRPSVAGIRAGRDEVLDAAMRQILHEYRSGGRGVH
jgi:C-terminal processing protease CtpA/Prc